MAADLYPNINFPSVDFSWLGNLPKVAEAARIERVRQSLGDLDTSTRSGLEKAAGRLIANGDIEGGLRAYQMATARFGIEEKSAAEKQYIATLKNMGGRYPGFPSAPGATTGTEPAPLYNPIDLGTGGVGGSGPRPGAFPPAGAGNIIPPRTLPESPGPGPQSALSPSPSEELLARAEGGAPPAPLPGPPTAQAGPPGTIGAPPSPPSVAPSTQPLFMQGAQMAPATTQPLGGTPPAPTRPAGPATPGEAAVAARQEAVGLGQQIMQFGLKAGAGPVPQALRAQFNAALRKMNLTDEQIAYEQERALSNRPGLTMSQFKLEQSTAPKTLEGAQKSAEEYEQGGKRAGSLLPILDIVDRIVKHPDFKSGNLTPIYSSVVNGVNSLAQIAGTVAPDISKLVNESPAVRTATLQHIFTSLTNSALMAHVGNLSKSFSDADRAFVERIFPNVTMTPDGIKGVSSYLRAMSKYDQDITRAARSYINDRGVYASASGLHDAVDKYKREHPLFMDENEKLTPRGESLMRVIEGQPKPSPSTASGSPILDTLVGKTGVLRDLTEGIGQTYGPLMPDMPGRIGPQDIAPRGPGVGGGSAFGPPNPAPPMPPGAPNRLRQGLEYLQGLPQVNIPGMAKGGPVQAGQPYTVGERGPETFVPQMAGMILPHHEGKVFFHSATGRPAGRIRGGKPVFFGRR